MSTFQKLLRPLRQSLVVSRGQLPGSQPRRWYADQIHPGYARLRKNQARFQVDDGCPIHLKKGLSDRVLYYTTLALCGVAMALNVKTGYNLIFPAQAQYDEDDGDED